MTESNKPAERKLIAETCPSGDQPDLAEGNSGRRLTACPGWKRRSEESYFSYTPTRSWTILPCVYVCAHGWRTVRARVLY